MRNCFLPVKTYPAGLDIEAVPFPLRLRAVGAGAGTEVGTGTGTGAGEASAAAAASETFCRLDRRVDVVGGLGEGCSGELFSDAAGFLFLDGVGFEEDWVRLLLVELTAEDTEEGPAEPCPEDGSPGDAAWFAALRAEERVILGDMSICF